MCARQGVVMVVLLMYLCTWGAEAACYKNCNRNGFCNRWTECQCFDGYTGNDCSKRKCPLGPHMGDVASATDTAHALAECSGRGTCDRGSGLCQCLDGFEGQNCARSKCANGCSGMGDCINLRRAASEQDGIAFNHSTTYTLWDADIIYGCKCNPGQSGADCSQRICEVAPDTRVTDELLETVELTCVCDGACAGTVKFRVMGTIVKTWITPTTTASAFATALSTSPPIFGARARSSIVEVAASSSTDGTTYAGSTAICNADATTSTKIIFKKQADMQYINIYRNKFTNGDLSFKMKQTITCDGTGGAAGTFRLSYDEEFSDALTYSTTLGAVETALAAMSTVTSTGATVVTTSSTNPICTTSGSSTHTITMTADRAPLPLVELHSSVHASISGTVSTATATVLTTTSTDGRGAAVKLCSGTGLCDFSTGQCECPFGWERDAVYGGCGKPAYYNSDWHGIGRCPGLTSTALGAADLMKQKNVPFDRMFISVDPSEWALAAQAKSTLEYWYFAGGGDPVVNQTSRTLWATFSTDASAGHLALDEVDGYLYMVDMAAGASFIARASVALATAGDVADHSWFTLGSTVVSAMTLDPHWSRRRLYYSVIGTDPDAASGGIYYLPLDESSPSATSIGATQSMLVNPSGLALHFEEKALYFIDKAAYGDTKTAIKKCPLSDLTSCSIVNSFSAIDDATTTGGMSSLSLKFANNTAIWADTTSDSFFQVPVTNTDFSIPDGDDTKLRNQYLEYFAHKIADSAGLGFTDVEQIIQDYERNFVLFTDKETRKVYYIRSSFSNLDPFTKGEAWLGALNEAYLPVLNRMDTPVGIVLDKGLGPPYAFGDYTECYSRGRCSGKAGNFECQCYAGYYGDCQARSCPSGPAWFSEPRVTDSGHDSDKECSNAGLCDRKRGECSCFEGFQGAACERTVCSGLGEECTGRGRCRPMRELADKGRDAAGNPTTTISYGSKPHDASTWDAGRLQGCLPDYHNWGADEYTAYTIPAATGSGLEELVCPVGMNRRFDEATPMQLGDGVNNVAALTREVQTLTCTADGGDVHAHFPR